MSQNMPDQLALLLAQVIARAWADPGFRHRLLVDSATVLAEMGLQPPPGMQIVVVEETPGQRYVAVPAPWMAGKDQAFFQRLQQDIKGTMKAEGLPIDERASYTMVANTPGRQHLIVPVKPGPNEMSLQVIDSGW